jgi:hypothetical protein
MTHHTQINELTTWFLNLPLDESIDNKRYKVWSLNLRPHEAQLKDQKAKKSSRRSSRRRKIAKISKRKKSGKAKQNGKEELRKTQNSPWN